MATVIEQISAYYQLVYPVDEIKRVISSISEQNLTAITFQKNNEYIIALRIEPEGLYDFDKKTSGLKIKYLPIPTTFFETILKNSGDLSIQIREVDVGELDIDYEYLIEEINQALIEKDYDQIISIIEENNLSIKKIRLLKSDFHINIYGSGIIWLTTNLQKSIEARAFLENLLSFLEWG